VSGLFQIPVESYKSRDDEDVLRDILEDIRREGWGRLKVLAELALKHLPPKEVGPSANVEMVEPEDWRRPICSPRCEYCNSRKHKR